MRLSVTLTTPPIAPEPKKNCRGAAHDFNALTEQRAYAWGVIGTQIRDVENFRAVVQDPNAVIRLTANDRATCAGL